MDRIPLKLKIIMAIFMISFMAVYSVCFGSKNAVIGVMIAMAGVMNLGNDLSSTPKSSFIKIMILLLILGVVSFINASISFLGCILTFLVVFLTTFSSYNLFGMSLYLPYLMCYFMMLSIPITIEELPMRLLSLVFGAMFIVGINFLVNKDKYYKLSKSTIDGLASEIKKAIDLKLSGESVSSESFKVVNNFYLSLFSKFQYKYMPSKKQEIFLNIVKAFQYIGWVLSKFDLTQKELLYLKDVMENLDVNNTKKINVQTKEMNLILLNLEIISNELAKWDDLEEIFVPKNINFSKEILKRIFSFKSPKFTFAFKMALILAIWELLTLIFNLPFTKWLYFTTIPLMMPYVNDMGGLAKNRLKGTIVGLGIFVLILILISHILVSTNLLMMILMIICICGMVYTIEDKFQMTIFSTIMSVMVSLMYITLPEALILKILWVIVAIIGVSIINFGFLPYSVEKETKDNLKNSFKLNQRAIRLIKNKCHSIESENKTALMIIFNLIHENIEVNEDNEEIFQMQFSIMDISNFVINYLDIHEVSSDLKNRIIGIIDNEEKFHESGDVNEHILLFSTYFVVNYLNMQKKVYS